MIVCYCNTQELTTEPQNYQLRTVITINSTEKQLYQKIGQVSMTQNIFNVYVIPRKGVTLLIVMVSVGSKPQTIITSHTEGLQTWDVAGILKVCKLGTQLGLQTWDIAGILKVCKLGMLLEY